MSGDRARGLLSAPVLALFMWTALCAGAVLPGAEGAPDPPAEIASSVPATQPRVIPRAAWGADESLRFNPAGAEVWPRTFWPIQKIIIHHTETQNNDPDPAGTIRRIYHDDTVVQGLGDISYNFLIDEQGRIYEGRYSRAYGHGESPTGQDQFGNGVMGAQAYGHNAGVVGIALLGTLRRVNATTRARAALERLVAWIAATHRIDPAGSSVYRNPATGAQDAFPNIAGHRDVNNTDCPGRRFYVALPRIRADIAALIAGKRVPRPKNGAERRRRRPARVNGQLRLENEAIARVLRRHQIVTTGGGHSREVALVFHDGPGPYTMKVISTLRSLHAAATFFAVGDLLIYFSDAAVAAHNGGFAIGNLTESYAAMYKLPEGQQRQEIGDQAARLRSLGIPSPRLFTPPYGAYDKRTLAVLRRLHMLMVLWSIDTEDYKTPGVQAIVRKALRGVKPGAIILLHDAGGDRTQTVQALPAIVRGLRSRGYKLVTVPRLMLDDPPRP